MNLNDVKMANLTAMNTRDGVAWGGDLVVDGQRVLHAENRGDGGCNVYSRGADWKNWPTDARKLERQLERDCRAATGLDFEALDAVTAATEEGEALAQGVEAYRLEFPD